MLGESLRPEAWREYADELAEIVLRGEPVVRPREAVNVMLAECYETLGPLLEAQRMLDTARGYEAALRALLTHSGTGPDERRPIHHEMAWVGQVVQGHEARLAGLRERFKPDLERVSLLRRAREALPAEPSADASEPT